MSEFIHLVPDKPRKPLSDIEAIESAKVEASIEALEGKRR